MKILSVDDNPQNLKLIQLSLEQHFEVRSSDGSENIVGLLESFKPDVILLDIMLGDKSGYDVCGQIRDSRICPDVVVIFVSSLSSMEDKMTAYGAGGDDYICKPINIQELDQKLHSIEKRVKHYHDLEEQYEYASQAAMSSMQQSSELGQLIAFFSDSMEVEDIDSLYRMVETFVKGFGSHCAIEFRMGDEQIQMPSEAVTTLESEILELGRSAKRIVSFGNNLLLNSKWCSLLVKKMPVHDPDLVGRLRDHYAILLGIIDSRMMLIDSAKNRSKERMRAIAALSNALDSGFGRIKQELHEQEKQAQSILDKMESTINITLLSLGLTDDQEAALLEIFDENREQFEDMMGLSVQIDNEIRQLDHLLGKID